MRSPILLLLSLLAVGSLVEAIYRPASYRRHDKPEEECKEERTTKKTTTTTRAPTTTTAPQCPAGFEASARANIPANSMTSVWCMKAVLQKEPIAIESAAALCAAQAPGAVLTTIENDPESAKFTAQLHTFLSANGFSAGALAVDGRRIPQCETLNKTVLDALPCSDKTKAFKLADPHTDPSFSWTQWADGEPSGNMWTYDVESCIQLGASLSDSDRDGFLNDVYCNFVKTPNDPDSTLYWNFGALCGVAPN